MDILVIINVFHFEVDFSNGIVDDKEFQLIPANLRLELQMVDLVNHSLPELMFTLIKQGLFQIREFKYLKRFS